MGLVFLISNFFHNKTYQANNWSAKKIPSCTNLALSPTFLSQRKSEQFSKQNTNFPLKLSQPIVGPGSESRDTFAIFRVLIEATWRCMKCCWYNVRHSALEKVKGL